ncbi:MAG: hypothetical protein IJN23_02755 [Akkermansia sp.]|nr:hypothetical protein [Akkermansia sp.]
MKIAPHTQKSKLLYPVASAVVTGVLLASCQQQQQQQPQACAGAPLPLPQVSDKAATKVAPEK